MRLARTVLIASSLCFGQWFLHADAQLYTQNSPLFTTPTPVQQFPPAKPKAFDGPVVELDPVTLDTLVPPDAEPAQRTNLLEVQELPISEMTIVGNKQYRTWAIERALKPIRKELEQNNGSITPLTLKAKITEINQFSPYKLQAHITANQAGASDNLLKIHVYEPDSHPFQVTLITDNQGRPGSGTYRWGTEIVNQNVFGVGDTLTTRYVGSLGSVLARATYDTMPLNARGGKFSLTYHFQRTDYDTSILELPRDPDAVSFANFFIVSYLQPIDKKRRFTAFGGFRYVPYDTRIDGIQKYNKNYYITDAGLQMVTNDRLGKTHAEINSFLGFSDDHTRETFWRQRFAFNRTFNLPKSNTLVVKGLAQYSHDFLPIGLDIVLGGAYSVRGYSEGLINSERGYTLSVEHHWPVPYLKKIAPKLAKNVRGVTFADWGHAWLDPSNPRFIRGQSNDSDATTLASVGIGFRARLSRFCQGFVDIGYGLFDRSSWELLQQPTVRAHFGIRSDMFQQAPGYVEHANRPPHMIFSKATASAESDKD